MKPKTRLALIASIAPIVLLFAIWAVSNLVVDPFGVFGDGCYNWYSYNMTQEPSVAKIAYLQKNHENYDSYIIGGSASNAYSVERLNGYLDASFYNVSGYGADILEAEQTARFVIESYEVKNLVLCLSFDAANASFENARTHCKVSGASSGFFYASYLFANPQYARAKLSALESKSELPSEFDIFNAETGEIDRRIRDGEHISSLDSYLQENPAFLNFRKTLLPLEDYEARLKSVAAIRDLCLEHGIDLYIIVPPLYHERFDQYSISEMEFFYKRLVEVTPFWDFALSSVSYEPRYFYDEENIRNATGEMALAAIFTDENSYYPDDFGVYVTTENLEVHLARLSDYSAIPEPEYSVEIPILLYHDISETGEGSSSIKRELFAQHIQAINQAGYNTISLDELLAYVRNEEALPEKPILITFDDGYISNYSVAFPILRELDMKATIFVIGSSVGRNTYKETGIPIIPHFSYEQAQEMIDSGLISIQSHTYDMHQWPPYESGFARDSAMKMDWESESVFITTFRNDLTRSISELEEKTTETSRALAFPKGDFTSLTLWLARDMGMEISMSTNAGNNIVIKGLPESLSAMNRYSIDDISADALLNMIA